MEKEIERDADSEKVVTIPKIDVLFNWARFGD